MCQCMEQNMDILVPRIIKDIAKVVQSMPQERVRKRTVAIPVSQNLKEIEEVAQTVSPCNIVQRSRSRTYPFSRFRRKLLK